MHWLPQACDGSLCTTLLCGSHTWSRHLLTSLPLCHVTTSYLAWVELYSLPQYKVSPGFQSDLWSPWGSEVENAWSDSSALGSQLHISDTEVATST